MNTDRCRTAMEATEQHLRDERGQGQVEYALILVLIAIGSILVLQLLTGALTDFFESVVNAF